MKHNRLLKLEAYSSRHPSMARKRIRDIRNDELIAATIDAVHQLGFANITLSDIARKADISPASINYYFGSKDQLLAATMQQLLSTLHLATLERLKKVTDAEGRLIAIVEANFDDSLFTVQQCSVWVQFWSAAPYSTPLARLHRINRSRVRSNLREALKNNLPEASRETVRRAIQAYMDGLWVQAAQSNRPVDARASREEARRFTELLLGQ